MREKPKNAIPGMTKLNSCPSTPGCDARSLWQDVQGGLWHFSQMEKGFLEHVCHIPKNEMPEFLYLGEWFNKRTQRVRFIPGRIPRSVKIPPASRTSIAEEWELRKTYCSKLQWEEYKEE